MLYLLHIYTVQVCKSDNITRNHLPIKRKIFHPSSFPCNSNLSLYIPFIPIIRLLHKRLNSTYIVFLAFPQQNNKFAKARIFFFFAGNIKNWIETLCLKMMDRIFFPDKSFILLKISFQIEKTDKINRLTMF